ncbi:MAG: hypothetical protein ABSE51_04835 [Terracidiphilus sp.]
MVRILTLLSLMAALCGALSAQTKTITIRMLDGRTGKLIATSGFLVRIDHQQTVHANWTTQNEDGTNKLTLPESASAFSIQGTYESSTELYVNCDSLTIKGAEPIDRWYTIPEILTSGVVAPNGCGKLKETAKLRPAPKPGEFIFFVRKTSWKEQMNQDYTNH